MTTPTQITGKFQNGYLDFNNEIYKKNWISALVYGQSKIFPLFENIRQPGNALKVDNIRLPLMTKAIINPKYDDATGQTLNHAIEGTVTFPVDQAINMYEHIGFTGNNEGWASKKIETAAQQASIIKDDLIFQRLSEAKASGKEITFTDGITEDNVNELLAYFRSEYRRHDKRVTNASTIVFFVDYKRIIPKLQKIGALSGAKTIEGTAIEVNTAFGYNLIAWDLEEYGVDIISTTTNNIMTFEQVHIPLTSGVLPAGNTFAGHQFIQYLEKYDAFVVDPTLIMYHSIETNNDADSKSNKLNLSNVITNSRLGNIEGTTNSTLPQEEDILLALTIANPDATEDGYIITNIYARQATISHKDYEGTINVTYTYTPATS